MVDISLVVAATVTLQTLLGPKVLVSGGENILDETQSGDFFKPQPSPLGGIGSVATL